MITSTATKPVLRGHFVAASRIVTTNWYKSIRIGLTAILYISCLIAAAYMVTAWVFWVPACIGFVLTVYNIVSDARPTRVLEVTVQCSHVKLVPAELKLYDWAADL